MCNCFTDCFSTVHVSVADMSDSTVVRSRRLAAVLEDKWIKDILPKDDIAISPLELPDLEQEGTNPTESARELAKKWGELGLSELQNDHPSTLSSSGYGGAGGRN
ncbi:unnamed protein product [Cyprideis torosa]|uniref:Anaphase-promoting complex subunit 13 n=1 Tax=Cyprideis torosa TaxID=163714 RepID=A0A7R8WCA6_9CRUS|nr:unnamed protein product [Cyprideis torosa]CAG0893103.1 unnamed protein product [Cyprideis torosa]